MIRALPAACLLGVQLAACGGGPADRRTADHDRSEAWLARGEALYDREEFDSAVVAFDHALARSRATRDALAEARSLTFLGIAAWRTSKYGAARAYGDSALAVKHRWGFREELFLSYNAQGLVAWNEGRLRDAVSWFDSASAAAEAAGRPEDVGKSAGNRALVEVELGEFSGAARGFSRMLAAGRASGNRRLQGNALTNLGMLAVRVGDPSGAIALLDSALRIYRVLDYSVGIQAAFSQLGTARAALGDPATAFAFLDSAVAIARERGLEQEVAASLEVVAGLHSGLGEPRRALAAFAEAQAINRRLGLSLEEASDLRDQAELYRALGDHGSAMQSARQALRIHREAGAALEELRDLISLSEAARAAGDSAAARTSLESASGLAASLNVATARVEVALARAREAIDQGSARTVLEVLGHVAPDLVSLGGAPEWQAWDLAAEAHRRLGRLDSAIVLSRRAVASIEKTRASLTDPTQRAGLVAGQAEVYARLLEALLQAGRTEDAFRAADRMRSRALAERLVADDSLLLRNAALEGRLRRADVDLAEGATASPEPRRQVLAALAEVRAALAAGAPAPSDPAGLRSGDPARLRVLLGADEMVVAFAVTDARTHLFVVRRGWMSHYPISAGARDLAARVRLARDLMGRPGTGAPGPVLAALDSLLFGAARAAGEFRGVRHLIIVPHGALAYLPFAALQERETGRYLADRVEISLAPSAMAIAALRTRNEVRGSPAAGAIFAPAPEALPRTRSEAEAVRSRMPAAAVFLGGTATPLAVRQALGQPQVVHIASHAIMNPANPLYSYLDLAAPPGPSARGSGRLTVNELLTFAVRSPLVFLSGCETGVGSAWSTAYRPGEDYTTLGQSLLLAGAGVVVATLWPIDDESAGAFAARFYRHFPGVAPAEALALTQREMRSDPRLAAPFHWAGYQVFGVPGRSRPVR